jgi:hypothetical protein
MYVMKYGEADAKQAEDEFFEFRQQPNFSQLFSQSPSRPFSMVDNTTRMTDAERQYMKQRSDVGVGLLSATNAFQPIPEQNEQV